MGLIGLIGAVFLLALVGGSFLIVWKIGRWITWNQGKVGERAGAAEYARIKREQPNLRDAQLGEAEFIQKFIKAGRGKYKPQ